MAEAVLLGAATIVRLVGALHATLLGCARMVAALSMASENMERNAATSRLTRPTDKARAVDGRIATESHVLPTPRKVVQVRMARLGPSAAPASVPFLPQI